LEIQIHTGLHIDDSCQIIGTIGRAFRTLPVTRLSVTFCIVSKAFDSVDRGCLWEILSLYGCPPTFINIIRLFHDSMTATVRAKGLRSDTFSVETGVKQGCVLAPTLFHFSSVQC